MKDVNRRRFVCFTWDGNYLRHCGSLWILNNDGIATVAYVVSDHRDERVHVRHMRVWVSNGGALPLRFRSVKNVMVLQNGMDDESFTDVHDFSFQCS